MRIVGKNLDAEGDGHGTRRHHTTQGLNTAARLGDRAADLLPDPLDDPDQLQDRGEAINNPPVLLRLDAGELRRRAGALGLHAVPVELGHHRGRLDASGHPHRGAGGLVDGLRALARTKDILLWMLSTKMLPAVGVLYPIYLICIQLGCSTPAVGADHRPDADQPADHRLDALHLLPRNPRRDPGGRADGRRGLRERSSMS
jgi:hypothetical protein